MQANWKQILINGPAHLFLCGIFDTSSNSYGDPVFPRLLDVLVYHEEKQQRA